MAERDPEAGPREPDPPDVERSQLFGRVIRPLERFNLFRHRSSDDDSDPSDSEEDGWFRRQYNRYKARDISSLSSYSYSSSYSSTYSSASGSRESEIEDYVSEGSADKHGTDVEEIVMSPELEGAFARLLTKLFDYYYY